MRLSCGLEGIWVGKDFGLGPSTIHNETWDDCSCSLYHGRVERNDENECISSHMILNASFDDFGLEEANKKLKPSEWIEFIKSMPLSHVLTIPIFDRMELSVETTHTRARFSKHNVLYLCSSSSFIW